MKALLRAWPHAAAGLCSLLLVDAAIETFRAGSPVRWWVAGIAAGYTTLSVLLRRRTTWRVKAAVAFGALLTALAATAWLPGGTTNGFRLTAVATGTLLSTVTACGVAIAVTVIWRNVALPRAARITMAAVGAYAIAAFIVGIVDGTPYRLLLLGGGLWSQLPVLIQGGFIGAYLLIPLSMIALIVRAGVPRFRHGAPRAGFYQIVALVSSLAIVLTSLPIHNADTSGVPARIALTGMAPLRPIVPSPALSAALENSLRAIEDGERESPRDRWDPAYVADTLGHDQRRIFNWVRDHTYWIPYRGLLRGAVGVLMDRFGNNVDRAVLLATLLQQAGRHVRLAHGELTREQAIELLPAMMIARDENLIPMPSESAGRNPEIRMVAAQYQLDGTAIERHLTDQAATASRVAARLAERVANQSKRLAAAIPKPRDNWGDRLDGALAAVADHWWVQVEDQGTWSDLDLLVHPQSPTKGLASARETLPLDALASIPAHEITIRVIAETWGSGRLSERAVLRHTFRPAETIGQPVALQFWPGYWTWNAPAKDVDARQAFRTNVLKQREWLVALNVGQKKAAIVSLRDTGDVNEHPATNAIAKVGGTIASGIDAASEALDADTEAKGKTANALTAAWIEFEIHVPGDAPRTIRRVVFDLVGPAARAAGSVSRPALDEGQRLTRTLALMSATDILPVVSGIAPEFVTHLTAQGMLANRDLLRELVRGEIRDLPSGPEDLAKRIAPLPSPLYALARARLERTGNSGEVHIERPDILTRHLFLAPDNDSIVLKDATDIVANEIGVDLRARDPFVIRVEQGVADTNAEALLNGGTVAETPAEAFAASDQWVTVESPRDDRLRTIALSPDVKQRIADDLSAGFVVLAPKTPIQGGSKPFEGWWRVDPVSGHVLGMGRTGWGNSMPEYGLLLAVLSGFVSGFLFAYLWCKIFNNGVRQLETASLCDPSPGPFSLEDLLVVPVRAEVLAQRQVPKQLPSPKPPEIPKRDGLFLDDYVSRCAAEAMRNAILGAATAVGGGGGGSDRGRARGPADTRGPSSSPNGSNNGTGRSGGGDPGSTPAGDPTQGDLCANGCAPANPGGPGRSNNNSPGGPEGSASNAQNTEQPCRIGSDDPLAKTQADLDNTQFDPASAPPGAEGPDALPETKEAADAVKATKEALAQPARESREALGEWIRYRANKPGRAERVGGDPSKYDAAVDAQLEATYRAKQQAYDDALNDYQNAQRGLKDAIDRAARAKNQAGCFGAVGGAKNAVGIGGVNQSLKGGT